MNTHTQSTGWPEQRRLVVALQGLQNEFLSRCHPVGESSRSAKRFSRAAVAGRKGLWI